LGRVNMIRGQFCFLVLSAVVSTGCVNEPSQPAGSSSSTVLTMAPVRVAAKTANVASAVVHIMNPNVDGDAPIQITFAGREDARRLEDAFQGLRVGIRAAGHRGVFPMARVEFHYDDGSVESIITDFDIWRDSQGREQLVSNDGAQQVAKRLSHLNANTRARILELLNVKYDSAPNIGLGVNQRPVPNNAIQPTRKSHAN
jgi:hypothetical protein